VNNSGFCIPAPSQQRLLSHLVFEQASRTPDALALAFGGESVTYSELCDRTNRLASYLRVNGVREESLVAICLHRSPLSVIAPLAVLQAGGAYLPLDPCNPVERTRFILTDAQPQFVLTDKEVGEGPWRTVTVPELDRAFATPAASLAMGAEGDNLAYVIYTSGSTGQPKGVEITHNNLLNLISWHRRAFSISDRDRATHSSSPGFDAAVWEIWPCLAAGASLHLAPHGLGNNPPALRDWLISNEITVSFVPTPLAEQLLSLEWPRRTALRLLLTGADTLHRRPDARIPFTLVNNYGPTECTVVSTSGVVLPQCGGSLPTIGRPIDNVQIHILNEAMQPVSKDEVGEIYIGGAAVGRGYRNHPEKTAERFVLDPFSGEGRLYRTGDLGRQLPDGQIEFIGRIDDQVKISGYRIELNEVVATLNRHSQVEASFACAKEEPGGGKRLVGYVVKKTEERLQPCALRDFLRQYLPEYMIPAIFIELEQLPLNASGKVDRSALPEPSEDNVLRDHPYSPPRTPIEERVAQIISRLLHIDRVSIHDNFFVLGGNSLLGTQVLTRVGNAFSVEMSLRSLFDHPTVAELATQIENFMNVGSLEPNPMPRV
jgi:amino acid adenylation domain-containing protein